MAWGRNFHTSCGKDGGKVGENPAVLRAAVFSLSSKNLRGGGAFKPPPPPSRARVKRTLEYFNIQVPHISPTAPLRYFWLHITPGNNILFSDSKSEIHPNKESTYFKNLKTNILITPYTRTALVQTDSPEPPLYLHRRSVVVVSPNRTPSTPPSLYLD